MSLNRLSLVGVNHLGAGTETRERVAFRSGELAQACRSFLDMGLREVVVNSTCSRVEVMGLGETPESVHAIRSWFLERGGPAIEKALYCHTGRETVHHLFRVTGGLDSWIVGECEILAQVKLAYQTAVAARTTGRVLNRVFQTALAAGKTVRAQTGIQNGIHSIGGAAALLVSRIFRGDTTGATLVVGAGNAAEAVVKHLAAKNFSSILVANRTFEKAKALAGTLGGKAVTLEHGLESLAAVEAAVFSASCQEPLLKAPDLARRILGRERPLFLVDLGLPRNIDQECGKLPNVFLYDLEHLQNVVSESMRQKSVEKAKAEGLIVLAVDKCISEIRKADRHSACPGATAAVAATLSPA